MPATYIYHRNKSKKTAIIGMISGALVMQVAGILANVYILLPLFGMDMKGAALANYIFFGLIPFNAIKAAIVSVLTYLLYKRYLNQYLKLIVNLKIETKRLHKKRELHKLFSAIPSFPHYNGIFTII